MIAEEYPPLSPTLDDEPLRQRIVRIVQRATGLHAAFSEPLAAQLEAELRRDFAGERLAVQTRAERALRRIMIAREFTGANHDDICRRYRISRRTLQRIVKHAPATPQETRSR